MMLLNRAGIVTRAQMAGARRYVIVGITALAAVLTPPDIASQFMLAIPMWVLYEGSLLVMWLGERREAKAGASSADGAGEQPGG